MIFIILPQSDTGTPRYSFSSYLFQTFFDFFSPYLAAKKCPLFTLFFLLFPSFPFKPKILQLFLFSTFFLHPWNAFSCFPSIHMSLLLTLMDERFQRGEKIFIFWPFWASKNRQLVEKSKKKKIFQNAQKSSRNPFLDPRKGFYDVFDTFWTYFFFDHFWPFLLCFMVILRPWGTMKVTKNGFDEL